MSVPTASSTIDLLKQVKTKGENRPAAMIVYGVEGVGKTSFAAQAPEPLFLMSRGETGLKTLIQSGQIAETSHVDEVKDWPTFMSYLDAIIEHGEFNFKTLVLDCVNGFEALCNQFVCNTMYQGDWGPKGFANFGKGYESASQEWGKMLDKLDLIREKKVGIIGLAHSKTVLFKNPEGADYDRYAPDMHKNQWSLTAKWADIILFLNYHTVVEKDGFKGKAKGGNIRIAHTERSASWDAKNRHGMPSSFQLGNSAQDAWANFMQAKKGNK